MAPTNRARNSSPRNAPAELRAAVEATIELLDERQAARGANRDGGGWRVNRVAEEGRAAVLSHQRQRSRCRPGALNFYDKVPLKYGGWDADRFAAAGVRVVPPATVRRGAYVAPNVVLMPSYVNVGAYVDSGTMVDTWATVGSCAQIGKNVHLSGGVGIGGVLEPLQASPTIIEDDCFIGARSEIVEGVVVESGAVISMGVFIGQSTRIYDRERDEILYGRVPAGAVVVPGTLPAANGKYGLACAVIVKRVDAQTRAKTSLNELLRND